MPLTKHLMWKVAYDKIARLLLNIRKNKTMKKKEQVPSEVLAGDTFLVSWKYSSFSSVLVFLCERLKWMCNCIAFPFLQQGKKWNNHKQNKETLWPAKWLYVSLSSGDDTTQTYQVRIPISAPTSSTVQMGIHVWIPNAIEVTEPYWRHLKSLTTKKNALLWISPSRRLQLYRSAKKEDQLPRNRKMTTLPRQHSLNS